MSAGKIIAELIECGTPAELVGRVVDAILSGGMSADMSTETSAQNPPPSSPSPQKDVSPTPLSENNPSPPISPSKPKSREGAGTRLPVDWSLPDEWRAWCLTEFPAMPAAFIDRQAVGFFDYWRSLPGAKGRKADWLATWRNWIRRAVDDHRSKFGRPASDRPPTMAEKTQSVVDFFKAQAEQDGEDEQNGTGEGERGNPVDAARLLGGPV